MHTTVFCHCMHACNKKLELYYKIHLFNLLFSHPCGNWLKFFHDMFSSHREKSQHCKTGIFFMTPLFDKQVSNENQEELPGSLQGILLCHLLVVPSFQASLFYVTLSVKLFQNQELEPRNGSECPEMDSAAMWTLSIILTLTSGNTSPCTSLRALVLSGIRAGWSCLQGIGPSVLP